MPMLKITTIIFIISGCNNTTDSLTILVQPDMPFESTHSETLSVLNENSLLESQKEFKSNIYLDEKELSATEIQIPTENTLKESDDIDLNDYFGEWEIIEDFGFIGITRDPIDETSLVGEKISFSMGRFCIADGYEFVNPVISAEMVDPYDMIKFNKYLNLEHFGFEPTELCVRIIINDPVMHFEYRLYALSEDEVVFDGGIHHYYRAVKE